MGVGFRFRYEFGRSGVPTAALWWLARAWFFLSRSFLTIDMVCCLDGSWWLGSCCVWLLSAMFQICFLKTSGGGAAVIGFSWSQKNSQGSDSNCWMVGVCLPNLWFLFRYVEICRFHDLWVLPLHQWYCIGQDPFALMMSFRCHARFSNLVHGAWGSWARKGRKAAAFVVEDIVSWIVLCWQSIHTLFCVILVRQWLQNLTHYFFCNLVLGPALGLLGCVDV